MEAVLSATQVRANVGEFIDTVVREKPQLVKRNRDIIVATSVEQMRNLLSIYELNFEFEIDEDGKYAGSVEEIDFIVAEGDTAEKLRKNLAMNLMEYAKDFMSDYHRYTSAPNTRIHAPYVLRIMLEDDVDAVASLLHGDAELE